MLYPESLNQVKESYEWVKYLFYALFTFLGIKSDVVKILFWLMLIDTCFGIIKTLSLGLKFKIKKLALGFISKLSILLIPMTIALIGKGLSFDFKWFVTAVMNILIVSEGISIFSNWLSIRQKKEVKNDDLITKLLNAIRNYLLRLFNTIIQTATDKTNETSN
ncbi:conserved membrane hypothetical protein [Tenacibaculum sp. 190524A05c]|uniref:phage holin family protein n=1 Tax=Tenacibaculum platacis TaxID=3137852 RepID=UPI0031FB6948